MRYRHLVPWSPLSLTGRWPLIQWPIAATQRSVRHQAFDVAFDQDQLAEARKWHQSFQVSSLPEGNTSFSRSSGPGGQHVNKFVFSVTAWFKLQAYKLSCVLT
jgi:peptidyl-tRNA hydrolase ICT1